MLYCLNALNSSVLDIFACNCHLAPLSSPKDSELHTAHQNNEQLSMMVYEIHAAYWLWSTMEVLTHDGAKVDHSRACWAWDASKEATPCLCCKSQWQNQSHCNTAKHALMHCCHCLCRSWKRNKATVSLVAGFNLIKTVFIVLTDCGLHPTRVL